MSPLPLGMMGGLLEVDLAWRTASPHPLDERLAELFVGGRGLGTALLVEQFLRLRDRYVNSPRRTPLMLNSVAAGRSDHTDGQI